MVTCRGTWARGDRLAFSNGIILLSVVAAIFIIAYQGNTEHLIALYALGVFTSFTIAQAGMVVHWRREKGAGWYAHALVNGVGAVTTALVVVVIILTKFIYGAWLVVLLIPLLITMYRKIYAHYQDVRAQLRLPPERYGGAVRRRSVGQNRVLVPIAGVTRVVENTLAYARAISSEITALYISMDEKEGREIREKWARLDSGIELVIVDSPFRTILEPILEYINKMRRECRPGDFITVLIPEFEAGKWWHWFLHNQTGWLLRAYFVLHEDVIVAVVPYKLR